MPNDNAKIYSFVISNYYEKVLLFFFTNKKKVGNEKESQNEIKEMRERKRESSFIL